MRSDRWRRPEACDATVSLSSGNGDFLGQNLNQIIGATAFENNVTPTGSGRARLAAHHTARAPEVDLLVTREFYDPNPPSIEVSDFANGDSVTAPIKQGEWTAALKLAGTNTVALGPATLSLKPFTGYFVYAIGSAVTASLDLRIIAIPNLKQGSTLHDVSTRAGAPRARRPALV